MMIGKLIHGCIRKTKLAQIRRNRQSWYQLVLKSNPCLKDFCDFEGEKKWLEKWRRWVPDVSPMAYRVFSQYIGGDINIIPYEVTDAIVEPILTPIEYREVYNDKNSLGLFFPQSWFQKTYLRRVNGCYYGGGYNSISRDEAEAVVEKLFELERNVVTKGSRTGGGEGVTMFHVTNRKLLNKRGEKLSLTWLEEKFGNDFLIEEALSQSVAMSKFCKSSVNTFRMVTLRIPGTNKIVCCNAVLRIGKEGSEVDNVCQGGCFVGIHDDGTLGKWVCDGIGRTSKIFNGIDFSQSEILVPNYENVKQFAIGVHEKVVFHDLVAMDIALKENNEPTLIEINVGAFSSNLFQLTTSSTFKEYTDVVMNYCTQRIRDYKPMIVY